MLTTFVYHALGSFSCVCLLCFASSLVSVADAGGAPVLQALECTSTAAGNYTQDGAYAANLGRLLAMLPNETVSKNGGFFNGTVGNGTATVYGLAMCAADFSRADCMDCLVAAGISAGGVVKRCPGSTTVSAMFDQCLLRYSDSSFFGTAHINLDRQAASSPARFAVSETNPYTLAQCCTWDLPPDACKGCLDALAANVSATFPATARGERKSYSCRVRYDVNTSFMVVPFNLSTGSAGTPTSSLAGPGSVNSAKNNGKKFYAAAPHQASRAAPRELPTRVHLPPASHVYRNFRWSRADAFRDESKPQAHTLKSNRPVMIGSIVAAVVFVVLVSVVVWLCVRHRAIKKVALAGPRSYSYEELYTATNGFSDERKLGQGAFGAVYRGVLSDPSQTLVAVKKIQRMSEAAWQEFVAEITIVTQLKHRNIVDLMGWCDDRNNPLLVYELMDRNLDYHLYPPQRMGESEVVLDWKKRYNTILDMANGLQYLHTARNECVLHRDIKPSNVMLDENLSCAKLCDFGLVKQINHDEVTPGRQTTVIGTRSYLDPECIRTSIVSAASDVYSFGLVLLEIACGRQPTMLAAAWPQQQEQPRRDSFRHRKSVADMADERLKGDFDEEQIERVIRVGFLCVLSEPDKWPDMATVVGTT
uniref:Protein kinase domain-containing protein n=1 Tax=Oryza meridionalis TaxID=40149 RepID=A0A0E0EWC5_9ORYZ